MPSFRVTGFSSKGGRIDRSFLAQTEQGARKKAERDGVTVEAVTRLASEPATERQVSYARSLGIPIPDSPTPDQMSDLISRAVERPASSWLVARAKNCGADLDPDRYLGLEYVSRQLNEIIGLESHTASVECAFWYVQSVLRHRLKAQWSCPTESGVPDAKMLSLAEGLVADEKALRSMRREYRNGPVYAYVEFGDGYGGTMSTRTAAFARAGELLAQAGLT